MQTIVAPIKPGESGPEVDAVADEFAARTVSKVGGEKAIVGLAIPEDVFIRLRDLRPVKVERMPDRAALQVVFEPGALQTLKDEGYFFSINANP